MNELLNRFMTMLRPQSAEQAAISPMVTPQMGMLNRLLGLSATQAQGAMQAAPEQLARSRQMLSEWNPGQEISPELMNQFMGLAGFAPAGIVSKPLSYSGFEKWFKGSKIVDEKGSPKVLYHGTPSTFDDFAPSKHRGAVFFTEKPGFANTYAGGEYSIVEGGAPNVRPVFINAKNPFDFENKQHLEKLKEYLPKSIWADEAENISKGMWKTIEDETVREAIKRAGFDAFYVKESGIKNLGVFEPQQIKSAISDPVFGLLD